MNRIVVCPEPLAAYAGEEIFRQGGSAIDAAVATAYAQAVVSPAMTTIGGTGVMNLFHAPTGRHVILDFLGYPGSAVAEDMFAGARADDRVVGYRSIAVPTFVRGTHAAFTRYGSGRVSWAAVLGPAIRYADEGFAVYPYMHQYWRADTPVQQTREPFDGFRMLSATPACAAIFTTGTRVHGLGERIVQPDLANTLRRIAADGPDAFYAGEIGRRMAADLGRHSATVTAEDLRTCRVEPTPPASGTYRDLTVTSDAFPNIGVFLIQVLNVLEAGDLRGLGTASPRYFAVMAYALSCAFRERAALADDPRAGTDQIRRLMSKEYARTLRARMPPACPEASGGAPQPGTTHVSTFDADGSAVSFTHSIGTGSGVVTPGLGFIYNNQLSAYDPRPGRPNSIAPGRRAVSGGGATIVLKDGRVRFVIGSPHGFRKISSMAHVLAGLVDFEMTAAAAVASPRIHCEADPRLLIEDTFFPLPPPTRARLASAGYRTRPDLYGGRVCLIDVDVPSGRASGASDPRGGGGLAEV
jgi:gamma-glutamyltranspeptidase/glutathione hydrolase